MHGKLRAEVLPQMYDHLGVRGGLEVVPTRAQLGAQFLVVVNLAVEYHGDAVVFVEDRLMAARKVDDGQPAHADGNAGIDEVAGVIRTTMHHCIAHALQLLQRHRQCAARGQTCYAAHQDTISSRRRIFCS